MAIDWKALASLDLKSAVIGAGLALAIAGTPTYFEYEGLKVQLNGAQQEKAGALVQAEAKLAYADSLISEASIAAAEASGDGPAP